MDNTLVEQLLDTPDLHFLLQEVNNSLQAEAKRRAEFYDWINEDHKAEFINGRVVLHSPVMLRHWETSIFLSSLLHFHVAVNDLGKIAVEKAMLHLTRNSYEPDICFFSKEKTADFEPQQMLFPAPDLVVEILSKSTEKIDRGVKKIDYAAHRIAEYWIIDADKQSIEQWSLPQSTATEYVLCGVWSGDQRLTSHVINGFSIEAAAAFDAAANQRAMQELKK